MNPQCPFHTSDGRTDDCIKTDCALYDKFIDSCIMISIANQLTTISVTLEEIKGVLNNR